MDPYNLPIMCPKYLALKKVRYGLRDEKGQSDRNHNKEMGEETTEKREREEEKLENGGDRKE